ncbi:hypothetical protein AgCh_008802 [Apium graveolens]
MDVKSAFLNEDLEEEIYVSQPPGFEDPNFLDYVYYLLKALYGLKQAPRAWYDTLSKFLLENHFTRDEKLCKNFSKLMQSKFQDGPRESHLVAIKRIFRYLKGTPKLGIWYPRVSDFDLIGYSYTNYAGINFWIMVFCDNKNAIAITENPVQHSRTKHIDIKYHFIREHVMNGTMKLHFVPCEQQLADIFTKPLDESTFTRICKLSDPDIEIRIYKWSDPDINH